MRKEELRDNLDCSIQGMIADGSSKNYKIFSEMLDDFDRQDVIDLHRTQLDNWRLLTHDELKRTVDNTGVAIHMIIENKYPLTQEMLSRMLNRRLEVDYERRGI
ncbi:hypothetical protein Tco_0323045 [Tanacetum coccineum]